MTEPLGTPVADYATLTHEELQALLARGRQAQAKAAASHVSNLFSVLGLLFAGNRKRYATYVDA